MPISNHCHLSKEKYRKEKFENGIFFGIIKKIPIGYFFLMVVKNRLDLKTQAELKYVNLFIKKEVVQRRLNWNIFKAKKRAADGEQNVKEEIGFFVEYERSFFFPIQINDSRCVKWPDSPFDLI